MFRCRHFLAWHFGARHFEASGEPVGGGGDVARSGNPMIVSPGFMMNR